MDTKLVRLQALAKTRWSSRHFISLQLHLSYLNCSYFPTSVFSSHGQAASLWNKDIRYSVTMTNNAYDVIYWLMTSSTSSWLLAYIFHLETRNGFYSRKPFGERTKIELFYFYWKTMSHWNTNLIRICTNTHLNRFF